MNQEQIIQIQMIEQEANQLNQQLELIENNVFEMEELKKSLDEIENTENKEILANLGKRIYIPVEIKDKKLIVEVGNKNFVKKSIPETKELIENQINKLNNARDMVTEELNSLQDKVNNLMLEIQKEQKKKGKN